MAALRIYGASDDLVEFVGAINDEFGVGMAGDWAGRILDTEGNGLIVTANYTKAGTWAVGVGPLDEGTLLPGWRIRLEDSLMNECPYSTTLVIDVPAGTTVEEIN